MSALTQITTRAKQLRNANKKLDWKTAVKKASAEYRAKHKTAVKKTARKKSPGSQTSGRKKRKKVGSTLLLERGENPRKKPTRIVKIQRTKSGTFKRFSTLSGVGQLNTQQHALKQIEAMQLHIKRANETIERWKGQPNSPEKKRALKALKETVRVSKLIITQHKKML